MCYRESYVGLTETGTARGAGSVLAPPGVACFHVDAGEAQGRVWAEGWHGAVPIPSALSDRSVGPGGIACGSRVNPTEATPL